MSCAPGQPCAEGVKRRRALAILGVMAVIFIALSVASFLDSRGQVVPSHVRYADFGAVEGKRVFQAYNCMGCHTIVGNGAYFGPDLTKLYAKVGPAWLEAFLPSAGSWPAAGAVRLQLQNKAVVTEAGVDTLEAYLEKYPGAAERIQRRGGHSTLMPNLPFTREEVGELIAFLKYTSAMNTEGWPPKPKVDGLRFPQATPLPVAAQPASASTATAPGAPARGTPVEAGSPAAKIALGAALVKDNGCTACHAVTTQKLVGPGWGGLYGSTVKLADGSSTTADDAFIEEKIVKPEARVVAGYTAGVMPSFANVLDAAQVDAIVAYIRSLKESKP